MSIVAAYAVPHPPLIVPAVGKGQEAAIQATIDGYEEVARRVAAHRPDTIIVTSPHAPAFSDGFFISDAENISGTMEMFGVPAEESTITATGDPELAELIASLANQTNIPIGMGRPIRWPLDRLPTCRSISCAISFPAPPWCAWGFQAFATRASDDGALFRTGREHPRASRRLGRERGPCRTSSRMMAPMASTRRARSSTRTSPISSAQESSMICSPSMSSSAKRRPNADCARSR